MSDLPPEMLDRLLAGDLPAADERRLAQRALDDPELFDQLTAAAIVKTSSGAAGASPTPAGGRRRAGRPVLFAVATLTAAAAIVLAVFFRSSRPPGSDAVNNVAAEPAAPPAIPQPVLLVARVDAASQPAFRTDAATSRPPRQAGAIVAIHEGEADIDLGSLDGLKQGMEVRAAGGSGEASAGRVTITAVFRERSRGRVGTGAQVRAGDRVEIAAATYVAALLEQAAARSAAGDPAAAGTLAKLAVSSARTAGVAPDVLRRALDQLGILEHQAGRLQEAGRLLAEAAVDFDAAPAAAPAERAGVLNELGAIYIEQRDYAGAERALQSALSYASGMTKMRVTNNLGAAAALRGDTAKAERLYREALTMAIAADDLDADRQAIEKNLAGLKTPTR